MCFRLILVAQFSLVAFSAMAEQSELGITTTGSCLKKVGQDRASVVLAASSLQSSASSAISEVTKTHEKLRNAIKNLNLADAVYDTESVNVNEEREWVDKKMVSRGYRARIALSVESSDISRMGEVITLASKQGIKEIGGLNAFVSKEKYKNEYEDCLEVATKNARDKAQKLAKGVGVKVGKVKNILEGGFHEQLGPSFARSMQKTMVAPMMGGVADSSPSIDAKPVDMSVSATLTFQVD